VTGGVWKEDRKLGEGQSLWVSLEEVVIGLGYGQMCGKYQFLCHLEGRRLGYPLLEDS
jgi:hypothetical protein